MGRNKGKLGGARKGKRGVKGQITSSEPRSFASPTCYKYGQPALEQSSITPLLLRILLCILVPELSIVLTATVSML